MSQRVLAAAGWFLAGVMVGAGLVAFFTGFLLALVGVVLASYLLSRRARGGWFFVVGAGVGAALVFLGDVLSYGDGSCRQVDPPQPFHECPASGVRELFWTGIGVALFGLVGAALSRLRSRRDRVTREGLLG